MRSIDIHEHVSLRSSQVIQKICRPLFEQLGFNFFRYLVRFPDGKRTGLCSNKEIIKYLYEEKAYAKTWTDGRPFDSFCSGVETWALNHVMYGDAAIADIFYERSRVVASIDLVYKHKNYCEMFYFGANNHNVYQIPHSILKRFVFYFREQADSFIRRAFSEKLILPKTEPIILNNAESISADNINSFIETTPINRFYIDDEYITKRELSCIFWMLKGKTAEEMAIILGISKRTAETHIENVKQKLNCYKQTALIDKIYAVGIAEFLKIE